jgi:glucose-6-phosphate 1-dehydrogenase
MLLREIIAGDHYNTVSSQEIELQWSIIDQAKQKNKNFIQYPPGCPNPAERFIEEL